MYEIRKRSTTQPDVWYPVAWSDMRVYAAKIAELMNVYEDGEFAVLKQIHQVPVAKRTRRGALAGSARR